MTKQRKPNGRSNDKGNGKATDTGSGIASWNGSDVTLTMTSEGLPGSAVGRAVPGSSGSSQSGSSVGAIQTLPLKTWRPSFVRVVTPFVANCR